MKGFLAFLIGLMALGTASIADTAGPKAEVAKLLKTKIAVEIRDAKPFWPAEDYHQDYAGKNPVKYKFYRWSCGRDQRIKAVWSAAASYTAVRKN